MPPVARFHGEAPGDDLGGWCNMSETMIGTHLMRDLRRR
jgi:hypothetical protein